MMALRRRRGLERQSLQSRPHRQPRVGIQSGVPVGRSAASWTRQACAAPSALRQRLAQAPSCYTPTAHEQANQVRDKTGPWPLGAAHRFCAASSGLVSQLPPRTLGGLGRCRPSTAATRPADGRAHGPCGATSGALRGAPAAAAMTGIAPPVSCRPQARATPTRHAHLPVTSASCAPPAPAAPRGPAPPQEQPRVGWLSGAGGPCLGYEAARARGWRG